MTPARTEATPQTPLVSVIMPFLDAVTYLDEAATSVLGQTWTALELLLVDDGGTDGSLEVAERVRARDPGRVRLLQHPGRANRGTGPSRLHGLRAAAGSLIAFLDADDVWEPGHLEHEVRLLQSSPGASVVMGRAWDWHSWTGAGARDELSLLAFAPGAVVAGEHLLGAVLRYGGYATPTCSLLAPAELLGKWTTALEDFGGMYEDQVLNSGLQLRGSVVLSGATSAWYRQHTSSLSVREAGEDLATRHDRGRDRFLHWLQAQLPDAHPLHDLVDAELAALAGRHAATSRPRPGADRRLVRRVQRSRTGRRAVSAAGRVVRAGRRWRRGTTGAVEQTSVPQPVLDRVLERHAEHLRGRTLLLAGDDLSVPARPSVLTRRPIPSAGVTGPHSALAALPGAGYDCVVVVADATSPWRPDELRHLRRVLVPTGVLLLVLPEPAPEVDAAAQVTFGADNVSVAVHPRAAAPPVAVLRAVVPAGPDS